MPWLILVIKTQLPADDTPSTQRCTLHLGFINLKLEFFLQQVFGAVAGELAFSNIGMHLGIRD